MLQLVPHHAAGDFPAEVVEGGGFSKATELPVGVVGCQSMVPASLDVEGCKVQRHFVSHLEEAFCELLCDELSRFHLFGGNGEKTPQDRVNAPFFHQPEGREEDLVQHQMALFDGLEGGVKAGEDRLDERVTEAESCG